ncbi:MAG: YaiI/YqxD family protein [Cellulosilyticum sp.]|nr:YaiI/YqxD family protein [Cellulosilyticum sp.]
MRILIDGDACPVIDITIEIAKNYGIEVIIFCDMAHFIEREGIEVINVSMGSDAVDFKILNDIKVNDIVVTQDYGLAAVALAKKAKPIHQSGFIYTEGNIDQLLFRRHLGREARRRGGRIKGPKKRSKDQDIAFEKSLKDLIEKSL